MSLETVQTGNFTVSRGYFIYPCDPTNGPIIATLPDNPFLEEVHTFKDVTNTASPINAIGLDGNGFQIDGQDSMLLFIQVAGGWGKIRFTGTEWSVVG